MPGRSTALTEKQKLHRLVDQLPEDRWEQAQHLLKELRNPRAGADGEPLSAAERKAIRKSLEQIQRGETISRESYRRRRCR